ncbi:unnamed protein product [Tilletia caries]|uniref:Protein kinase domain-containing protein n=1 Tax=Tilletia caries TaxID=13290 RepID=A0ABN7J2K1_9BASI|nr:unnamed protein product [Tilletia caries]
MKLTLIFAATLLTFVSAACDGPFHEQCKTTCYGDSDCIAFTHPHCRPNWPARARLHDHPTEYEDLYVQENHRMLHIVMEYSEGGVFDSVIRRYQQSDDSSSEHRLCIKTGYDKALEQRQQLHVGLLNKIAQDIWADADPTFKQISVCHFPQLGYLLNILVMEDASEELPT